MRFLSAAYSQQRIDYPSHYHQGHEVLLVLSGRIRVSLEKEVCQAGPGDLVIFSRFESHAVEVLSPQYSRYTLQIGHEGSGCLPENPLLSSALVNRSPGFRRVVSTGGDTDAFVSILKKMKQEQDAPGPMTQLQLELLLQQFMICLYRLAPELFSAQEGRSAAVVSRIQREMERDYREPFSLDALAAKHHISPSYLAHSFKAITGFAPMEYLAACRLDAAKELLTSTDMGIQQIVDACGYTDDSNFSRTFKKRTGMTPTAFRKKYRM